jgi:hypothetical protein
MAPDTLQQILAQAKAQLSPDEQRWLAQELSQHAATTNGAQHQLADVADPREARIGPATSDFTQRLRALRKEHLAKGGRLLNMDEVDELLADHQGSLSEAD